MMMMNLNLKKNNILIGLLILINITSNAQVSTTSRFNFYASLGGVFNGSINTSNSNEKLNTTQTFAQYQDSISSKETWRLTINPQIGLIYQLSRKSDLQVGLSYIVLGHQRQLNNLKYKDMTYPGVGSNTGQIVENTNVERSIDLNYRYQYLQIPVIFNYHLNAKSIASKVKVSLSSGIGFNLLLNHDIKAVLSTGFTMDNKTSFAIDSTGYKGSPFTTNVLLGSRIDYNYSKQLKLFAQPMLGYFPISTSSNQLEAKPLYLNISFGVLYTLDNLK